MKKITLLTTGILCAASLTIGATAASIVEKIEAELRPDFEIIYEGNKQSFKNVAGDVVYPILYKGSTYLPVRAVSEMINKEVTWYEADKRIEIKDAPVVTVTDADKIVTEDANKQPGGGGAGSSVGAVVKIPAGGDRYDDDRLPADAVLSAEDVKVIVLEKAGVEEADVANFKIEIDDGKYEVEFKVGRYEYEAKISAVDGKVLEWEFED